MRKLIIAAILIITMLSLSSCIGGSRVAMLNRAGDSGKAEARCEQIVNAINSRDRDAIMAVFSETALSEAEDIDGGIDYLFSLFENDIETWEVTMLRGSESVNDGHKTKSNDFYFTTDSGEKEFRVYIREDIIDTEHDENVGVYFIKAIENTDESFANMKDYHIGGIHVPFDEDGAARIRFEKVFNLIKDKDKDAIRALFSENALSEARDIDGEIDELFNFFPNGIDSWEQQRRVARRWITPDVREIDTAYVYAVYADGKAYWFQIREYLDWTGQPEIVGVDYILISRPDLKDWYKLYSGINIWEE